MTSADEEDAQAANTQKRIAAVVLAAGQSRRMGQPKMLLPWRNSRTVIEQVVQTLLESSIDVVVVVCGAYAAQIRAALNGLPVRYAQNEHYADTEMLTSMQIGLQELEEDIDAALVVLGDQPALETSVVKAVVKGFVYGSEPIVVPSYEMRRGHPWLISRRLWDQLRDLPADQSLRDFLNQHASDIRYISVDSPGILKDMDTPEDYRRLLEDD